MPTEAPPTKAASDSRTVQRVAKQQVAQDVPEGELDHVASTESVRWPNQMSRRRTAIDSPR